jgi:hsdS, type I site-specific deoxyribonuclease
MYMTKLSSIADYVTDKISSNDIALREYVTTDCILQNKKGREIATNLPPQSCCLTRYQRGDVLIANIRPYLKKVWFADIDGGASSDVLVFRAKEGHSPSFLYAVLLQDSFFDYVMQGAKGSKMPRGDKEQILRYEMPTLSCSEESIGTFFLNLDQKIRLDEQINQNLEAMVKQLYDYWFVQFDFPNEEGKPYKSSGGEMVWNEELKREIPALWETKEVADIANVYNGATPSTVDELNYGGDIVWITPKDLSDQKQKFIYQGERNISQVGYDSCSTHLLPSNTILMSSRAPIGLLAIAKNELCTNQGFKSFVPKYRNIAIYLYYYLQYHLRQIEQLGAGTTFKEVSREDIIKFPVLKPSDNILDLWEERVSAFNDKQLEIQKENENLTKQRDELLPLLMNGQVSVNSDLSDD